jgi:hypothetical protein
MNMGDAIRIEPGTVIQIDPDSDEVFGGCLLTVTEARGWGVIGYLQLSHGERAYVRVIFKDIEAVGTAHWWSE